MNIYIFYISLYFTLNLFPFNFHFPVNGDDDEKKDDDDDDDVRVMVNSGLVVTSDNEMFVFPELMVVLESDSTQ